MHGCEGMMRAAMGATNPLSAKEIARELFKVNRKQTFSGQDEADLYMMGQIAAILAEKDEVISKLARVRDLSMLTILDKDALIKEFCRVMTEARFEMDASSYPFTKQLFEDIDIIIKKARGEE